VKWTKDEQRVYEEIGRRIKARREECELSQDDLGKQSGISRQNVANIEAGRQRIQVHTLLAFASTLMCSPSKLLP
jgi:transcriptional regulator with XRE-family HTH domain